MPLDAVEIKDVSAILLPPPVVVVILLKLAAVGVVVVSSVLNPSSVLPAFRPRKRPRRLSLPLVALL